MYCLYREYKSRMTTAWIEQSPGLYRATKEKGSCTNIAGGWCIPEASWRLHMMVQHGRKSKGITQGGAIRKNTPRDCIWWCNQEGNTVEDC